ncbi:hypothetical protein MPSEU_000364800 [Mayamaea pseudoterrestris]|nr:hypothetical protein MPSEU_000364800 [Mayamaea pseudoterrestris]
MWPSPHISRLGQPGQVRNTTDYNIMVEIIPESRQQKLARKSANAWTKFVGVCMTSETLAKIKAKELKLKHRKQLFGKQYFDFVQQDAPPETLERCFALARTDIDSLEAKINLLKDRKAAIHFQVRNKMVHKPNRWDSEQSCAKMMEQLMTTEPTDVYEVYYDEVETDYVAYATPVTKKLVK